MLRMFGLTRERLRNSARGRNENVRRACGYSTRNRRTTNSLRDEMKTRDVAEIMSE